MEGFPRDDVNGVGVDGMTPLLRGAAKASVELLREIVACGAFPGALTRDGANAIWLACRNNDVTAIELLAKAGVDPHHRNPDGSTALIYAASAGKTEAVASLIRLGADPIQENVDGFSALDLAANMECLQLLRMAARQRRSFHTAEGIAET